MEFLNLMLGGAGRGFVEAALLIGLFWAALGHPERIRSFGGFRTATILLGISMVLPVIIQLYVSTGNVRNQFGGRAQADPGLVIYAMALPPLLTMLAVIIGVGSVTPTSNND